jgi:pantoate--beta-alanine ligase
MQRLHDINEWREYADAQRARGRRVGLVATMGALHAGHASLFREAKANGDLVIATVFVNPRQFNDAADLSAYPRTPEADYAVAQESGVDCLVEPTLAQMWPDYPRPTLTTVSVRGVSEVLEGADRPGHFDGVASVVAKLFAITGPCNAYFGEKDFQQLVVVRQMVRDLGLAVDVRGCPIIRDEDGLALASRNVLLSPEGRDRALALSRALGAVRGADVASGHRRRMREVLERAGVEIAYAEVVDPITLVASRDDETGERRALIAALVEGVRLIDNAPVTLVSKENRAVSN